MKELFNIFWAGIYIWAGLPRLSKKDKLKVTEIRRRGNTLRIDMIFYEPHYGNRSERYIEINTETGEFHGFSEWLFNKDYKGSGLLGVFIMSLPLMLPLAPILLLINWGYRLREKISGISRHSHSVLNSIKRQLDPETRKLLEKAMKKMWQKDLFFSRTVSFKKAKEMLSECHLNEMLGREEFVANRTEWRQYHWFDGEKNRIGFAQFGGGFLQVCWILGSNFEQKEADILTTCYKTRTVIDIAEDRKKKNPEKVTR